MTKIHPTAIIEDGATIGNEVEIGPYSIIGPKVTLGDGVKLLSHVVISGITTIGSGTRIFPFASMVLNRKTLNTVAKNHDWKLDPITQFVNM